MALLFTLVMCVLVVATRAAGSGRAFPIDAENYIIEKFQQINPSTVWDATNYLVDKSGYFANCAQISRGYKNTKELTPDGRSIGVVYDHMNGKGVDVESVSTYIEQIVDDWMKSSLYDVTIKEANTFGCSVRPGCRGIVTVACLFSPGRNNDLPPTEKPNDPTDGSGDFETSPFPSSTTRLRTTRPPLTYLTKIRAPTTQFPTIIWSTTNPPYKPKGLAFTPEQYRVAEMITGNEWDRSHFLENLSGLEITCNMLNAPGWYFTQSTTIAKERGIDVLGLEGTAPNLGSTQDAMEEILKSFKTIAATKIGCSVIPDCRSGRGDLGGELWVIIACIYEEY